MKIIKRVGDRLPNWLGAELRPVLAFTGAGRALAHGSLILIRRGWTALDDRLDGWERYGAVAFAGYALVYGCAHAPHIARFAIPAAAVSWCVAAWWVAPPAAAPRPDTQAAGPAHDFVPWLLDLMGDRPGVHLAELYPAMRTLPGHEDRDNTQLRAALTTLGIPVRRTLRIDGLAGRSGVARADVEALPSPSGERPGERDGDAGQATDSPAGESGGERVESA